MVTRGVRKSRPVVYCQMTQTVPDTREASTLTSALPRPWFRDPGVSTKHLARTALRIQQEYRTTPVDRLFDRLTSALDVHDVSRRRTIQLQWRHSLWTRVDKVQGPQGSKGPRAMQQKSTSMYHEIQVMFHSIKAHVIYPIMDTAIFQFQSRFGGHLETVHLSILKMSAKPIR